MIYPLEPLYQAWRQTLRPGLIRLMLLDVDGCLTAGEASPLDFDVLRQLQDLNRRAAEDPCIPALTLCTGRPEPYVELLVQALGGYLPAIWENGAGLYFPVEYRFRFHPLLDHARLDAFDQVTQLVTRALIRPGLAYRQPGKEVSISLYPTERSSIDQVEVLARQTLEPLREHYWVQGGLTCVEVLPVGIHKGSGVRWLLDLVGLAPDQVLGVGDGPGDLEIFRATGLAATPANGHASLKAAADFVAPRAWSAGVLDILEWCIARNRAALKGSAPS